MSVPSADALPAVRKEVAWVFVAITLASVLISRIGSAPPFDEYVHVAVASMFLWTAVQMTQRDRRGVAWYGLALGGLFDAHDGDGRSGQQRRGLLDDLVAAAPLMLRELGVALALALLIFPPFALGFAAWHGPTREFIWSWPADAESFVLAQVVVVGLPEEALFRGYFQTRLTDLFPQTWRRGTWRVPWLAIVIQALLFALLHFAVDVHVTRLAVFFPGLVFGALRAWRGGIGAAVFFHALCNLYSDALVRGWL